jgi:hypothetical protein
VAYFGTTTRKLLAAEERAGNVLLPGEGARIAPTTFDEWLAQQR